MPGIGGLELLARLKQAGFRLPIIIMTGHGDIPTAVRAIRAGAVDFLEKPFDDEQLITATKAALLQTGSARLPGEAAVAAVRIATLSRRERQVLEGLMAGHQNKVIAYELGISVRTVEVHRSRMLEHLGTRSLADAIRLAVMANLTSTAEVAQSK
jgi:two-component system response regulator FixJ